MLDVREKTVILIPVNEPTDALAELCRSLAGFHIVCVDVRGEGLSSLPEDAEVLRPEKCGGRGAALKLGLRTIAECDGYADCTHIVTADVGNSLEDIVRVAEKASETGGVVLGARRSASVWRKLTDLVFRIAAGKGVVDSMTGLRAIPREMAASLADLPGERFEFEMNALLWFAEEKVPVAELAVGEAVSDFRFHPITDTVRLYWSMFLGSRSLKYIFSSGAAFVIDYVLFVLLGRIFTFEGAMELIAAPGAWVVSSLTNFFMNRNFVFRSDAPLKTALPEYYGLAGVVFLLKTYVLLELMVRVLGLPPEIAKLVAEVVFFVSNYFIQKKFIFKKKK